MMHRPPAIAICLLALAGGLAAPRPLVAQTVVGQVIDPEAGPLDGVHLRLLDADDRAAATAFSDDGGRFHLAAPEPGRWRIGAQLLGYGPVVSDSLLLTADDTVQVEIRMAVDPVTIDEPVVVIGAPARMSPDIEDFHRRREWGEKSGLGHFIHGDEIELRGAGRPTDLLRRIPGVNVASGRTGSGQIVRMRGRCIPAIYVDGSHINNFSAGESLDTYVAVQSIEGVEVYRGSQQPAGRFVDRSGCGLVLVWTKRGQYDPGATFSWARLLIGVGLLGGLIVLF